MNSEVCLTCLETSSESRSINEIILEDLKVIDLIRQLVPSLTLEQPEITLPDIICIKCLKELVISFKFQKKCLDSFQNFYKIVTNSSLNTKVADDNIEYNNFNENSVTSLPDDLKITIDEISVEGITAAEKCGKAEKVLNNEENCNNKSSNDLPEREHNQPDEESPTVCTQCKICSKKFKLPRGLASHMSKTHLKKHLYQCQKCNKGFDVEDPFIRHCNRHLGIKPFPCSQCEKSFETKYELNKHKLVHSKEHTYTCKICDKKFHRMDVLKLHTKRHDEESFECLKCGKTFERFADHKKHLDSHKNLLEDQTIKKSSNSLASNHQIENDQCDKDSDYIMLTQIKSEANDDTEATEILLEDKKEFNTKSKEKEIRFENDYQENDLMEQTESAQCDLCNQTFKNSQGLAIHRSNTHFKNYLYQCDQCDRGFNVEEIYIKHRNKHLGIKAFKCNQCDKAFVTNSILNQHLISHSEAVPHLCTVCGKGFRRIDGLRQHMKRHSDERPIKCSVCPKSFKCLSDKFSHMLSHTKKRYECHICGTRLASSESLAQHNMTHTGEKPNKCKYCDKSFISSSNLKCHERTHTGEKPYKCHYCSKTFCQSGDRKKHTKRMHKSELEDAKSEEKEQNS